MHHNRNCRSETSILRAANVKLKVKNRQPPKRSSLEANVEMMKDNRPAADSVDPDVASYVRPYLEKLFSQMKAPEVDLTSKESALDSLKTIELSLAEINSAIQRTRSLRNQLEQQRRSKGRR